MKEKLMVGEINLNKLLESIAPELLPEDYVFCSVQGKYGDFSKLSPLASFNEVEGLTLIITKEAASLRKLTFGSVFKAIKLTVHSSLDAVGLTAAVSTKLTEKGISANVVAAYYHDYIFVQANNAQKAVEALHELGRSETTHNSASS